MTLQLNIKKIDYRVKSVKKVIILAVMVSVIMFGIVAFGSNKAQSSVETSKPIESVSNSTTILPDDENINFTEESMPNEEPKKKTDRVIDPKRPMVALTFDDGPHPVYTVSILDALEKHNASATFFIVGNRAEKYSSVVEKIAQSGSQIGNHTYDHKELTKLTDDEIKNELAKASEILERISNIKPDVVRPTYGSINGKVKLSAQSPLILWSIDTLDWKTRNKDKILNTVIGKVKDGDIILMHDIYKPTAEAAEVIIDKLSEQGYQLVTIEELYTAKGVEMEKGKVYTSANVFR